MYIQHQQGYKMYKVDCKFLNGQNTCLDKFTLDLVYNGRIPKKIKKFGLDCNKIDKNLCNYQKKKNDNIIRNSS